MNFQHEQSRKGKRVFNRQSTSALDMMDEKIRKILRLTPTQENAKILALNIKRGIFETRENLRKTPEFAKKVHDNAMLLHDYNCRLEEVVQKYILDKSFKDLIIIYIKLELSILKDPNYNNPEYCGDLEKRILSLLCTIYSRFSQNPQDTWRLILHLFTEVPYDVHQFFDEIVEKVKKKIYQCSEFGALEKMKRPSQLTCYSKEPYTGVRANFPAFSAIFGRFEAPHTSIKEDTSDIIVLDEIDDTNSQGNSSYMEFEKREPEPLELSPRSDLPHTDIKEEDPVIILDEIHDTGQDGKGSYPVKPERWRGDNDTGQRTSKMNNFIPFLNIPNGFSTIPCSNNSRNLRNASHHYKSKPQSPGDDVVIIQDDIGDFSSASVPTSKTHVSQSKPSFSYIVETNLRPNQLVDLCDDNSDTSDVEIVSDDSDSSVSSNTVKSAEPVVNDVNSSSDNVNKSDSAISNLDRTLQDSLRVAVSSDTTSQGIFKQIEHWLTEKIQNEHGNLVIRIIKNPDGSNNDSSLTDDSGTCLRVSIGCDKNDRRENRDVSNNNAVPDTPEESQHLELSQEHIQQSQVVSSTEIEQTPSDHNKSHGEIKNASPTRLTTNTANESNANLDVESTEISTSTSEQATTCETRQDHSDSDVRQVIADLEQTLSSMECNSVTTSGVALTNSPQQNDTADEATSNPVLADTASKKEDSLTHNGTSSDQCNINTSFVNEALCQDDSASVAISSIEEPSTESYNFPNNTSLTCSASVGAIISLQQNENTIAVEHEICDTEVNSLPTPIMSNSQANQHELNVSKDSDFVISNVVKDIVGDLLTRIEISNIPTVESPESHIVAANVVQDTPASSNNGEFCINVQASGVIVENILAQVHTFEENLDDIIANLVDDMLARVVETESVRPESEILEGNKEAATKFEENNSTILPEDVTMQSSTESIHAHSPNIEIKSFQDNKARVSPVPQEPEFQNPIDSDTEYCQSFTINNTTVTEISAVTNTVFEEGPKLSGLEPRSGALEETRSEFECKKLEDATPAPGDVAVNVENLETSIHDQIAREVYATLMDIIVQIRSQELHYSPNMIAVMCDVKTSKPERAVVESPRKIIENLCIKSAEDVALDFTISKPNVEETHVIDVVKKASSQFDEHFYVMNDPISVLGEDDHIAKHEDIPSPLNLVVHEVKSSNVLDNVPEIVPSGVGVSPDENFPEIYKGAENEANLPTNKDNHEFQSVDGLSVLAYGASQKEKLPIPESSSFVKCPESYVACSVYLNIETPQPCLNSETTDDSDSVGNLLIDDGNISDHVAAPVEFKSEYKAPKVINGFVSLPIQEYLEIDVEKSPKKNSFLKSKNAVPNKVKTKAQVKQLPPLSHSPQVFSDTDDDDDIPLAQRVTSRTPSPRKFKNKYANVESNQDTTKSQTEHVQSSRKRRQSKEKGKCTEYRAKLRPRSGSDALMDSESHKIDPLHLSIEETPNYLTELSPRAIDLIPIAEMQKLKALTSPKALTTPKRKGRKPKNPVHIIPEPVELPLTPPIKPKVGRPGRKPKRKYEPKPEIIEKPEITITQILTPSLEPDMFDVLSAMPTSSPATTPKQRCKKLFKAHRSQATSFSPLDEKSFPPKKRQNLFSNCKNPVEKVVDKLKSRGEFASEIDVLASETESDESNLLPKKLEFPESTAVLVPSENAVVLEGTKSPHIESTYPIEEVAVSVDNISATTENVSVTTDPEESTLTDADNEHAPATISLNDSSDLELVAMAQEAEKHAYEDFDNHSTDIEDFKPEIQQPERLNYHEVVEESLIDIEKKKSAIQEELLYLLHENVEMEVCLTSHSNVDTPIEEFPEVVLGCEEQIEVESTLELEAVPFVEVKSEDIVKADEEKQHNEISTSATKFNEEQCIGTDIKHDSSERNILEPHKVTNDKRRKKDRSERDTRRQKRLASKDSKMARSLPVVTDKDTKCKLKKNEVNESEVPDICTNITEIQKSNSKQVNEVQVNSIQNNEKPDNNNLLKPKAEKKERRKSVSNEKIKKEVEIKQKEEKKVTKARKRRYSKDSSEKTIKTGSSERQAKIPKLEKPVDNFDTVKPRSGKNCSLNEKNIKGRRKSTTKENSEQVTKNDTKINKQPQGDQKQHKGTQKGKRGSSRSKHVQNDTAFDVPEALQVSCDKLDKKDLKITHLKENKKRHRSKEAEPNHQPESDKIQKTESKHEKPNKSEDRSDKVKKPKEENEQFDKESKYQNAKATESKTKKEHKNTTSQEDKSRPAKPSKRDTKSREKSKNERLRLETKKKKEKLVKQELCIKLERTTCDSTTITRTPEPLEHKLNVVEEIPISEDFIEDVAENVEISEVVTDTIINTNTDEFPMNLTQLISVDPGVTTSQNSVLETGNVESSIRCKEAQNITDSESINDHISKNRSQIDEECVLEVEGTTISSRTENLVELPSPDSQVIESESVEFDVAVVESEVVIEDNAEKLDLSEAQLAITEEIEVIETPSTESTIAIEESVLENIQPEKNEVLDVKKSESCHEISVTPQEERNEVVETPVQAEFKVIGDESHDVEVNEIPDQVECKITPDKSSSDIKETLDSSYVKEPESCNEVGVTPDQLECRVAPQQERNEAETPVQPEFEIIADESHNVEVNEVPDEAGCKITPDKTHSEVSETPNQSECRITPDEARREITETSGQSEFKITLDEARNEIDETPEITPVQSQNDVHETPDQEFKITPEESPNEVSETPDQSKVKIVSNDSQNEETEMTDRPEFNNSPDESPNGNNETPDESGVQILLDDPHNEVSETLDQAGHKITPEESHSEVTETPDQAEFEITPHVIEATVIELSANISHAEIMETSACEQGEPMNEELNTLPSQELNVTPEEHISPTDTHSKGRDDVEDTALLKEGIETPNKPTLSTESEIATQEGVPTQVLLDNKSEINHAETVTEPNEIKQHSSDDYVVANDDLSLDQQISACLLVETESVPSLNQSDTTVSLVDGAKTNETIESTCQAEDDDANIAPNAEEVNISDEANTTNQFGNEIVEQAENPTFSDSIIGEAAQEKVDDFQTTDSTGFLDPSTTSEAVTNTLKSEAATTSTDNNVTENRTASQSDENSHEDNTKLLNENPKVEETPTSVEDKTTQSDKNLQVDDTKLLNENPKAEETPTSVEDKTTQSDKNFREDYTKLLNENPKAEETPSSVEDKNRVLVETIKKSPKKKRGRRKVVKKGHNNQADTITEVKQIQHSGDDLPADQQISIPALNQNVTVSLVDIVETSESIKSTCEISHDDKAIIEEMNMADKENTDNQSENQILEQAENPTVSDSGIAEKIQDYTIKETDLQTTDATESLEPSTITEMNSDHAVVVTDAPQTEADSTSTDTDISSKSNNNSHNLKENPKAEETPTSGESSKKLPKKKRGRPKTFKKEQHKRFKCEEDIKEPIIESLNEDTPDKPISSTESEIASAEHICEVLPTQISHKNESVNDVTVSEQNSSDDYDVANSDQKITIPSSAQVENEFTETLSIKQSGEVPVVESTCRTEHDDETAVPNAEDEENIINQSDMEILGQLEYPTTSHSNIDENTQNITVVATVKEVEELDAIESLEELKKNELSTDHTIVLTKISKIEAEATSTDNSVGEKSTTSKSDSNLNEDNTKLLQENPISEEISKSDKIKDITVEISQKSSTDNNEKRTASQSNGNSQEDNTKLLKDNLKAEETPTSVEYKNRVLVKTLKKSPKKKRGRRKVVKKEHNRRAISNTEVIQPIVEGLGIKDKPNDEVIGISTSESDHMSSMSDLTSEILNSKKENKQHEVNSVKTSVLHEIPDITSSECLGITSDLPIEAEITIIKEKNTDSDQCIDIVLDILPKEDVIENTTPSEDQTVFTPHVPTSPQQENYTTAVTPTTHESETSNIQNNQIDANLENTSVLENSSISLTDIASENLSDMKDSGQQNCAISDRETSQDVFNEALIQSESGEAENHPDSTNLSITNEAELKDIPDTSPSKKRSHPNEEEPSKRRKIDTEESVDTISTAVSNDQISQISSQEIDALEKEHAQKEHQITTLDSEDSGIISENQESISVGVSIPGDCVADKQSENRVEEVTSAPSDTALDGSETLTTFGEDLNFMSSSKDKDELFEVDIVNDTKNYMNRETFEKLLNGESKSEVVEELPSLEICPTNEVSTFQSNADTTTDNNASKSDEEDNSILVEAKKCDTVESSKEAPKKKRDCPAVIKKELNKLLECEVQINDEALEEPTAKEDETCESILEKSPSNMSPAERAGTYRNPSPPSAFTEAEMFEKNFQEKNDGLCFLNMESDIQRLSILPDFIEDRDALLALDKPSVIGPATTSFPSEPINNSLQNSLLNYFETKPLMGSAVGFDNVLPTSNTKIYSNPDTGYNQIPQKHIQTMVNIYSTKAPAQFTQISETCSNNTFPTFFEQPSSSKDSSYQNKSDFISKKEPQSSEIIEPCYDDMLECKSYIDSDNVLAQYLSKKSEANFETSTGEIFLGSKVETRDNQPGCISVVIKSRNGTNHVGDHTYPRNPVLIDKSQDIRADFGFNEPEVPMEDIMGADTTSDEILSELEFSSVSFNSPPSVILANTNALTTDGVWPFNDKTTNHAEIMQEWDTACKVVVEPQPQMSFSNFYPDFSSLECNNFEEHSISSDTTDFSQCSENSDSALGKRNIDMFDLLNNLSESTEKPIKRIRLLTQSEPDDMVGDKKTLRKPKPKKVPRKTKEQVTVIPQRTRSWTRVPSGSRGRAMMETPTVEAIKAHLPKDAKIVDIITTTTENLPELVPLTLGVSTKSSTKSEDSSWQVTPATQSAYINAKSEKNTNKSVTSQAVEVSSSITVPRSETKSPTETGVKNNTVLVKVTENAPPLIPLCSESALLLDKPTMQNDGSPKVETAKATSSDVKSSKSRSSPSEFQFLDSRHRTKELQKALLESDKLSKDSKPKAVVKPISMNDIFNNLIASGPTNHQKANGRVKISTPLPETSPRTKHEETLEDSASRRENSILKTMQRTSNVRSHIGIALPNSHRSSSPKDARVTRSLPNSHQSPNVDDSARVDRSLPGGVSKPTPSIKSSGSRSTVFDATTKIRSPKDAHLKAHNGERPNTRSASSPHGHALGKPRHKPHASNSVHHRSPTFEPPKHVGQSPSSSFLGSSPSNTPIFPTPPEITAPDHRWLEDIQMRVDPGQLAINVVQSPLPMNNSYPK